VSLHGQAITVLDENKKVLAVDSACENGWGLNDREKHSFKKQTGVRDTIIAQEVE
jgi:hypothetical protein